MNNIIVKKKNSPPFFSAKMFCLHLFSRWNRITKNSSTRFIIPINCFCCKAEKEAEIKITAQHIHLIVWLTFQKHLHYILSLYFSLRTTDLFSVLP